MTRSIALSFTSSQDDAEYTSYLDLLRAMSISAV